MAVKTVEMPASDRVLVELPASHGRTLVAVDDGVLAAVDDRCRHRGGPLHLAYTDPCGVVRCPWHDRPVGRPRASRDVSAILRVGSRALTLVAEAPGGAPWPVRALGD